MVRIGVTGHRILTDIEKISAGIDAALRRIERVFPAEGIMVISSLAEGTDRLVARRVLMRDNARLVVPLPLPQADCLTDFESDESKREFIDLLGKAERVVVLPPAPTRNEAYAAAGRYVLDHCTVLLAVWDGREARGQGGTSDIVACARQRGVPFAWVHAGNCKPGTTEPTSLGEEQGKVTFENL